MSMSMIKEKLNKLPVEPGVYIFLNKAKEILYIGKATNLRSRVKSYFQGRDVRGERIFSMVRQIADIKIHQTDSVLEALILESNLVKKHQPKYNVDLKDDKSFSYFAITKEIFPRILIVRKTDLKNYVIPGEANNPEKNIILDSLPTGQAGRFRENDKREKANRLAKLIKLKAIFGPYTSKKQMEVALKIIRKIFPFHSSKQETEKGCLDFQIGLCPGPYASAISKKDYQKNIRGIRMILEGKKKNLVKKLEKEMQALAKKHEFEKAADLRNKVFALNHINDVALISRDFESENKNPSLTLPFEKGEKKSPFLKGGQRGIFRIEAYDISNISGQHAVGSMVVFSGSEPDKSEYRKFKIKTVEGSNDVGMMREVLLRRFKNDWSMPDLILLDGGIGHFNMAENLLQKGFGLDVAIVAVAKGPSRKNVKIQITNKKSISNKIKEILNNENLLKQIMDEAHRFAITYHRKLRRKNFL